MGVSGTFPDPAPETPGRLVLVVEDHEDTRALMELALKRSGYRVVTASGVQEALERCQQLRPEAVLCDLAMPDGDGIEFIARFRAISGPENRVPAVAVSAFSSPKDQQRALRAGFDHYMTKPFNLAALIDWLRRALPGG